MFHAADETDDELRRTNEIIDPLLWIGNLDSRNSLISCAEDNIALQQIHFLLNNTSNRGISLNRLEKLRAALAKHKCFLLKETSILEEHLMN